LKAAGGGFAAVEGALTVAPCCLEIDCRHCLRTARASFLKCVLDEPSGSFRIGAVSPLQASVVSREKKICKKYFEHFLYLAVQVNLQRVRELGSFFSKGQPINVRFR